MIGRDFGLDSDFLFFFFCTGLERRKIGRVEDLGFGAWSCERRKGPRTKTTLEALSPPSQCNPHPVSPRRFAIRQGAAAVEEDQGGSAPADLDG